MFTTKKIETALWIIAALILILWITRPNWPYWEPLLGIVNLIAIGLIRWVNSRLEKAEYSPALALALGYINNYIEPLVTGIARNNADFKVLIFIPKKLSDLSTPSIERIKHKIEKRNLKLDKVSIELEEKGRIRSCLEIKSIGGDNYKLYFDFPETLKSLEDYINYKIVSKKNSDTRNAKNWLGDSLIREFTITINELIEEKSLSEYVAIVDDNLDF